jgi:dephospho-CoA kinase
MICIGITGTIGAGKGTVVEYLVENKGFRHFSVRGFLLEQIRLEGLPEDRDSMFLMGNRLRELHGPSYVVDCLYDLACSEKGNCVIESIRTTGEIMSLRKKGQFYLLAVDAEQSLRYKRIVERKSETDLVSFSIFKENEEREMSSADPARQNLRACIRLADFVLTNNGTKEELFREVEKILMKI